MINSMNICLSTFHYTKKYIYIYFHLNFVLQLVLAIKTWILIYKIKILMYKIQVMYKNTIKWYIVYGKNVILEGIYFYILNIILKYKMRL